MNTQCCNFRCTCTLLAIVASLILGVVSAFLLITGVITVGVAFLWVALGIAVVYLGVLLVATALARRTPEGCCLCTGLNVLLTGILGTALFGTVLLAVGITATSAISPVGTREKVRPEATLVTNQLSRFTGKAWSILHIRLLNRSPNSSWAAISP